MDAINQTPLANLQEIRDILVRLKLASGRRSFGGYPDEIFKDLMREENHELICNICYMVLKKTRECSNGHRFCHSCISTWSEKGARNSTLCPVCREDGLYVRNRCIDEYISHLLVICSNSECEWSGNISEWRKHTRLHDSDTQAEFFPALNCSKSRRVPRLTPSPLNELGDTLPVIENQVTLFSNNRSPGISTNDITPTSRFPNLYSDFNHGRDNSLTTSYRERTARQVESPVTTASLQEVRTNAMTSHSDMLLDSDIGSMSLSRLNDYSSELPISYNFTLRENSTSPVFPSVLLPRRRRIPVQRYRLHTDDTALHERNDYDDDSIEFRTNQAYRDDDLTETRSAIIQPRRVSPLSLRTGMSQTTESAIVSPPIPPINVPTYPRSPSDPEARLVSIYQMRQSMRDIRQSLESLVNGVDDEIENARRVSDNMNMHIHRMRGHENLEMGDLMVRLESVVDQLAEFVTQGADENILY